MIVYIYICIYVFIDAHIHNIYIYIYIHSSLIVVVMIINPGNNGGPLLDSSGDAYNYHGNLLTRKYKHIHKLSINKLY